MSRTTANASSEAERSRRFRLPARVRERLARAGDDVIDRGAPSYALCTECGWLEPPRPLDPLRRDAVAIDHACPCCSAHAWADLGRHSTVLALRELDERESLARAPARRRAITTLGGATGALGGVALLVAVLHAALSTSYVDVFFLAMIGACLVMFGSAAVSGIAAQIRGARPKPRPARWRLALPSPKSELVPLRGAIEPSGEPLRAPLSGRACAAWEVGVRTDDDGHAKDGTWLLLEQHSAPATVGGRAVAADAVRLDLDRVRADPEDPTHAAATSRFLHERGFLSSDTTLRFFEAIVPVGAEVTISREATGAVLRAAGAPGLARVALAPAE
jgi:hypothetical protein